MTESNLHLLRLNESIRSISIPHRMQGLPISRRGYPVPWFVALVDGEWDFRVIAPNRTVDAIKYKRCWLCGEPMGVHKAFVAGPMCMITRTSAEPPSHYDCARYAVKACPFLTNPNMRRNEKNLPEDRMDPAGVFIKRNPGVTAILVTRSYGVFKVRRQTDGQDFLIRMGEPERIEWYYEGRLANKSEVQYSIDTGMPALEEQCQLDRDPASARRELRKYVQAVESFMPAT